MRLTVDQQGEGLADGGLQRGMHDPAGEARPRVLEGGLIVEEGGERVGAHPPLLAVAGEEDILQLLRQRPPGLVAHRLLRGLLVPVYLHVQRVIAIRLTHHLTLSTHLQHQLRGYIERYLGGFCKGGEGGGSGGGGEKRMVGSGRFVTVHAIER